jgi:PhoH-like ATPase
MYTGIANVKCNTDEEFAELYEHPEKYSFTTNQYVLIKDKNDNIVDKKRWDGESLVALKYRQIENRFVDKVKPRNVEQEFYFDLLQNPNITGKLVCSGFGTGKSFVAMSHLIDWVFGNKPRYDKIVFIRNMQTVKDIGNHVIGSLPGDINQKQIMFAMQFADILGSVTELESMIESDRLVLEPLAFCRGRSYTKSAIYISEAQNLSTNLMALIMSRVGEGSVLVVDGDIRQTDTAKYENDNGMLSMIDKLQGHPLFGMVTLNKNERSEFSTLSDLLLDK